MIKISLIINRDNNNILKFEVDTKERFVMTEPNGNESIIIDNMSNEYDGICDSEGRFHFLLQPLDGSLIYIKYDTTEWKKYIVFKSKSKIAKMSDINLTMDKGVLCGFYIMEHKDRIMLIKHIFSSSNLYATPEVIELLDARKDYCICTAANGMTEVYCRNSNGDYVKKTLDSHFSNKTSQLLPFEKNVFNFCCVNSGTEIYWAYTTFRKGYTALIFSNQLNEEKIITFAVAKNCKPSLVAKGNFILLRWNENNSVMECISNDGGKTFCKPKILGKSYDYRKYRQKNSGTGIHFNTSLPCIPGSFNPFEKLAEHSFDTKQTSERMHNMTHVFHKSANTEGFKDTDSKVFLEKLSAIEKEVAAIGKDISEICIFLDELVKFKEEAKKDVFPLKEKQKKDEPADESSDIGEENSDNIKLFESMDIDDVLPTYAAITQQGCE